MIYQLQRWYRLIPDHALLAICLFLIIESVVLLAPVGQEMEQIPQVKKERLGNFAQFKSEFQQWQARDRSSRR